MKLRVFVGVPEVSSLWHLRPAPEAYKLGNRPLICTGTHSHFVQYLLKYTLSKSFQTWNRRRVPQCHEIYQPLPPTSFIFSKNAINVYGYAMGTCENHVPIPTFVYFWYPSEVSNWTILGCRYKHTKFHFWSVSNFKDLVSPWFK